MEQEELPEHQKLLNERQDKENRINMQLISETSLQAVPENEDKKIQLLIELKSIHLEWLSLPKIENLEVFEHLTILYLQHNLITKIQGLDHLLNLQYLALNDNRISALENLKHLKKLSGLNLSNNHLQEIASSQLPQNLEVVSFKGNPVCLDIDYKQILLKHLKSLQTLDDQTVTPAQKFKLFGMFPANLSTYASQLNHFYTKKQLKARFQQENKPVLLNTDSINEKEALSEIRQKTRKYLYQNEESFKREQKEQTESFGEKIAVSKKIRQIKEKEESDRLRRIEEIKESTLDELIIKMSH